ncbi:MAG: HPr-rel-A system PqqD family peptide chaperone [Alphaproteobacteria bacterium]|nr:HPr-rel-A system PqqD family peptide chaperone [Alphaproteobacteria bacterium]
MADDDGQYLYRAEGAEQLLVRRLDDLTLIYHRRSGLTHMVTAPVPEILTAMGGDALSALQILSRLSDRFDLAVEDEGSQFAVIAARLEELAGLGLVERL